MAERLEVSLAPGEAPDAVNVSDAASQRVLEKLATERGGADSVVTAYAREKGRQPQRAGAMSGLFDKPSQTPEFYEMLLAWLVEQTPLPQGDLDDLADRRGKAVLAELVERQRLDQARLALGKAEAGKTTPEQRVAIRLELNMD